MDLNTYVSRGGHKLELPVSKFKVNFNGKQILDVGSSTGGFSDFALKHGAKEVIAIELGTNQMEPKLRLERRIRLYEKTDIRNVEPYKSKKPGLKLSFVPDIVLIDVSFVSLRLLLPHIAELAGSFSQLVVLVKPQFEAEPKDKNHGVIKNETIRRRILKDFEIWVRDYYVIKDKVDSSIFGSKGNKERFYLLVKKEKLVKDKQLG